VGTLYVECCFPDIQSVLGTQVKGQKPGGRVSSYNPTVVNYHWGYFSNLLMLLRTSECTKAIVLYVYSMVDLVKSRSNNTNFVSTT